MKRLSALICAASLALAATAAPEITWLGITHNFGAFDESQGAVSCDFRFVNSGDAPLTVLAARASCGCTQPLFPSEAVAPGDTASIAVAYNPAGRPGRFRKTISVETNAVNEAKTRLTISGVVIGARTSIAGRYPVDKGALHFRDRAVMFGRVDRPHLKTVFAEAYNRSSDSITPRVVAKPRYIDINFEPRTVGPGEQLSVICYLRTAEVGEWGLVEDSIRLADGGRQFTLPLTAIIQEDFSTLSDDDRAKAPVAVLSDESVDFGRLDRGAGRVTREIILSNTGRTPLEVRRVYTVDRGVDVGIDRATVKPGKKAVITVTTDPAALDDMLNARISVITNDPADATRTIRAVAEITK